MNTSTSSLSEMINSSIVVLTRPSVSTFEQYERRGGMRDALIYVGVAAALAGIVGFIFNLIFTGVAAAIGGLIAGLLTTLLGFTVFAFVLYFVGKQQGGTGSQDEVFYTCALYTAPLLAITGIVSAIPGLNCLLLPVTLAAYVYQLYLGYLASRSSMNLGQTPAIIAVVAAILAQWVVGLIIAAIVITPFVINAATSGG
ncbi:MAG TPA: Yip1 family protein [Herpetosiphonaceae bacterium]